MLVKTVVTIMNTGGNSVKPGISFPIKRDETVEEEVIYEHKDKNVNGRATQPIRKRMGRLSAADLLKQVEKK